MGEIGRRLVHASGVVFPGIYLVGLVEWWHLQYLLVLASGIAIVLEVLRLRYGLQQWWLYEKLTREYEQETVAGYALYLFSSTAVVFVFEPGIAIPAMLMLMLGDPVSGYLSSGELRTVKGGTSVIAMFVVSLAVTLPFTIPAVGSLATGVAAAVAGAGLATVADGVKATLFGRVVDDNLTIPPAGAIGIWVVLVMLAG